MAKKGNIAPDMEDFYTEPEPAAAPQRRRKRQRTEVQILDDDEEPEAPRSKPRVHPDDKGPTRPGRARRPEPKTSNPLVSIKEFFTDHRLHVAVGIVLCFLAVMSVAMCISFMTAHTVDQSVEQGRTIAQVVENGDAIQNWGNITGAKIGKLLMVNTLGVGSFALAVYLFLLGLACMHVARIKFWSVSFRCLFTAVAVSVIVGLFTINQALTFPLGGEHGLYINQLLINYAGELGAYGVSMLLLALLATTYFFPIRSFFRAVASVLPHRHAHPEPVDETEPDSPENSLQELDRESNEKPEIKDVNEEPSDTLPDDTPAEPEDGGGFVIDDAPVGSAPAEEVQQEVQGEALEEASEEVQLVEIPEVVASEGASGDPEMIIRVAADEPAAEEKGDLIRNGDHIGLDSVYDPRAAHSNYQYPPLDLLVDRSSDTVVDQEEQAANKQRIVQALRSYGIEIVRIEATIGPTVTLYEIVPAEGIRISKIKSLEDDIAMTISASGIRIIAPIPGRGTIGIEVPNRDKQVVSMRQVIASSAYRAKCAKMQLPLALGKTISNEVFIEDLTKMPHLLVAGATGQGKSVGLNCIITSLLYAKHPDELKFVLVDPKMVEFSVYSKIDKAFMAKLPEEETAIITDAQKALATLNSLCIEMDARYELFSQAMARDVVIYNDKFTDRKLNPENGHRYMPYIVAIVDEFADLITSAGKEIFVPIARLAAKGRAAGIHIIIATQRPSTDVITGMIKANFPARIAFRVLSGIDSKTILDRPGAHRLIGRGDMLTLINGSVERVQCAFVDTPEAEAICDFIGDQDGFVSCYELPEVPSDSDAPADLGTIDYKNEEFVECCRFISMQSNASITILQRKFSIGFNKAGRYIDQMEQLGIVGPANGSKPRQVLMTLESVDQMLGS